MNTRSFGLSTFVTDANSYTTSVVRHKLNTVPSKKEKLPLSVTHPELAKEADGWDPSVIISNNSVKLNWRCNFGHIWEASIQSRSRLNSGCPYCVGLRPIKGFNDLMTTHKQLANELIEPKPESVMSGSHKAGKWKCKENHFYVMSIRGRVKAKDCPICSGVQILPGFNDLCTTNPDVSKLADGWDPTTVSSGSNKIKKWKCENLHSWQAPVYSLTKSGTRCPTCAGQQLQKGFNDLATTHPLLANQAYGWDPTVINASSKEKKKWLCPEGHIFEASILNRSYKGDECGICSGRQVLVGYNDLKTTYPHLALEALDWDPTTVVSGSNSKRKWRCPDGHSWVASVNSRTGSNLSGCPSCAKSGYDPNQEGFLYFLHHPAWEMYQIGITNYPDSRLGSHQKLGWEVIELRGPMDGHLTQQWETAILRMLKAKGADLSNKEIAGKFDGYSEAWSKSTFEVKSIKELMRLTEDFENN